LKILQNSELIYVKKIINGILMSNTTDILLSLCVFLQYV